MKGAGFFLAGERPCGCHIKITYPENTMGTEIVYCPLHAAGGLRRTARAAIAKATGKEL